MHKRLVPQLDVLLLRFDRRVVHHDDAVRVAKDGWPAVLVLFVARAVPELHLMAAGAARERQRSRGGLL